MAPSSHISPKGRLELSCSEEAFPNNLEHLVSRHSRRTFGLGSPRRLKLRCNGACLPGTSRGCRNSVTPDALSFSSLGLTRVMPLFGSARYEQWL